MTTTNLAKISFETPSLIGALCKNEFDVPKNLCQLISPFREKIAFLPLQVEKKYLKNIIECIKLMDIESLFICEPYSYEISRHLKNLDEMAKSTHYVDVIIRERKKIVGKDMMGKAVIECLSEKGFSKSKDTVAILGRNPLAKSINNMLKSIGWKTVNTKGENSSVIINLDEHAHVSGSHCVAKTELMGLFYQRVAELLTNHLKNK